MSENIKTESELLSKPMKEQKTQKKKSGYGNWLFRTEGTAAEPWPTAEELWNDPNVQREMKEVREVFNHVRKKQNSS